MNKIIRTYKKRRKCYPYYVTKRGKFFLGFSEDILNDRILCKFKGKIKLIFTSPPFPLNRKKRYGNLQGKQYISWLSGFAKTFSEYLSKDGSIVIEIGNAWVSGIPAMSTLPLESLLKFKEVGNFYLCQEFIYYNPARLPSPIQWVNVERIRVKDAFTRLWWLSTSCRPDADNKRVLVEYSKDMKRLLKCGKYNFGRRPSEHVIGMKSFLQDNGGAIPPNVIIASNTAPKDSYLNYCCEKGFEPQPARMPEGVASFFIRFMTRKNDWIMDPFAGSNITGVAAEKLKRRWIAIEANKDYVQGSIGRFINLGVKVKKIKA